MPEENLSKTCNCLVNPRDGRQGPSWPGAAPLTGRPGTPCGGGGGTALRAALAAPAPRAITEPPARGPREAGWRGRGRGGEGRARARAGGAGPRERARARVRGRDGGAPARIRVARGAGRWAGPAGRGGASRSRGAEGRPQQLLREHSGQQSPCAGRAAALRPWGPPRLRCPPRGRVGAPAPRPPVRAPPPHSP